MHSKTNPYVEITPANDGVLFGHLDDDFGGTRGDHQDGEDIIPHLNTRAKCILKTGQKLAKQIWRMVVN